MSFTTRTLQIVKGIPQGKVLTYGEVACLAGSPGGARAVGMIMSKNHDPAVPCHRVICADGSLGGYNRGVERKREILRKEGYLSK